MLTILIKMIMTERNKKTDPVGNVTMYTAVLITGDLEEGNRILEEEDHFKIVMIAMAEDVEDLIVYEGVHITMIHRIKTDEEHIVEEEDPIKTTRIGRVENPIKNETGEESRQEQILGVEEALILIKNNLTVAEDSRTGITEAPLVEEEDLIEISKILIRITEAPIGITILPAEVQLMF